MIGYSDTVVGFKRLSKRPLEYNSVFDDKQSALNYVTNDSTAYEGQVISIKGDGIYMIIPNDLGGLKLATVSLVGNDNYFDIDNVSDSITINHNMGKFPTVNILDTNNEKVYLDIQYIDLNNVTLTWNGSFTGRVYLT